MVSTKVERRIIIRERTKFIRNPCWDYRQGAETFFEGKKGGLRFIWVEKKGGKDFFGRKKRVQGLFLKKKEG